MEIKPWQYQFPPCKRWVPTDSHTRMDQKLKIVEEASEVVFAPAPNGCQMFYAIELMDVIHACETALRELSDDLVSSAKEIVICKNSERGYYDDAECDQ